MNIIIYADIYIYTDFCPIQRFDCQLSRSELAAFKTYKSLHAKPLLPL